MTKARRLNGRSVVVLFSLASLDRLTRDRLVGVAGQSAHNGVILHLNTKPGPSVMGFPFDLEAQPEVTVLHIHPTAHVVHGGGPDVDGSHLFSGEVVGRANLGAKLEGRGVGPEARPTFGTVACRRPRREIGAKSRSGS